MKHFIIPEGESADVETIGAKIGDIIECILIFPSKKFLKFCVVYGKYQTNMMDSFEHAKIMSDIILSGNKNPWVEFREKIGIV